LAASHLRAAARAGAGREFERADRNRQGKLVERLAVKNVDVVVVVNEGYRIQAPLARLGVTVKSHRHLQGSALGATANAHARWKVKSRYPEDGGVDVFVQGVACLFVLVGCRWAGETNAHAFDAGILLARRGVGKRKVLHLDQNIGCSKAIPVGAC